MRLILFLILVTGALQADELQKYFSDIQNGHSAEFPKAYQNNNLKSFEVSSFRKKILKAWQQAAISSGWQTEVTKRHVLQNELSMPYTLKRLGEKPSKGWDLLITLHGGGTTHKEINDRDWRAHQNRYRPKNAKFVALRAPRNHLIWHPYIYPMLRKLISQMILFEDVNPNRIFITGYSEGGYSMYRQFSDMPDAYAAMAASAAGGIEKKCPADNLMNTPAILQVGEFDNGFKRAEFATNYAEKLAQLKKLHPNYYNYKFIKHTGRGHSFDDRGSTAWLQQFTRNTIPKKILWQQGHWYAAQQRFWLQVFDPQKKTQRILAERHDNHFEITCENIKNLKVLLNKEMVDFQKNVTINVNGQQLFNSKVKPNAATMIQSLATNGDPAMIFTAEVRIQLPVNQ